VFKVAGLPERLFVASFLPDYPIVWVDPPPPPPADPVGATVVKRFAHIEKAGAEERYVLGIVLEPEVVDAQNDIYSAAEIASSAHVWMEKFRTIGLMHKGAVNDKVKVLESYLAPIDFEVDGVPVKKGTWLMAVRVLDDDLWAAVKEGGLTGFSIGGSAVRKPDADRARSN
jgi:DNA adenine methylase